MQLQMAFDQGTVRQVSGQIQPGLAVSPWSFQVKYFDDNSGQGQFSHTDQSVVDREQPPQISMNLALGAVDLNQWLDWRRDLPSGETQTDWPTLQAVLEVEQLFFGEYQTTPGTVDIRHQDDWQVAFDGADLVGQISISGGQAFEQVDLDFQRLVFHPRSMKSDNHTDPPEASQPTTWPLEQLPEINIHIDHAAIGELLSLIHI